MDVKVICYHKKSPIAKHNNNFYWFNKIQKPCCIAGMPQRQSRENPSMFLTSTEINVDWLKCIMYYHRIIVESLFNINLSLFVNFNCVHVSSVFFTVYIHI